MPVADIWNLGELSDRNYFSDFARQSLITCEKLTDSEESFICLA